MYLNLSVKTFFFEFRTTFQSSNKKNMFDIRSFGLISEREYYCVAAVSTRRLFALLLDDTHCTYLFLILVLS